MNRKRALAIIFTFMLLASLAVDVHIVKADSIVSMVFPGGVTLFSPLNETYNSNYLVLNLNFSCAAGVDCTLNYTVDNAAIQSPIPLEYYGSGGFQMFYPGTGVVQLPELSYGSHQLTIYEQALIQDYHGANAPGAPFKPIGNADYAAYWVDTVDFFINSSWTPLPAPSVTILEMQNQTYNSTDVPLTFTVDQNITQAAYTLDGESNVTIAGNTTLTDLAVGVNNVTVYAWNDAGSVGASGEVNFTVTNPTSVASHSSEPSPMVLVIVSVVIVAMVFAGFLVY